MENHKDQEDKHNHSSSSSSSSCSSDDHIVFENPFRNKFTDSLPPKDPQSFSFVSDSSANQSPVPVGYELNRLPSSIFSSKPPNGTEWSVASNESLFSIQIGNSSFARDHAFMIFKSGELTFAKTEEPVALPPVEESDNVSAVSNEVEEESNGAIELKMEEGENVVPPTPPPPPSAAVTTSNSNSSTSISVSPLSDDETGSNHSTLSFAFQVLAPGDDRKNSPAKEQSGKRDVEMQLEEQKPPESLAAVPDTKAEVQPKHSNRRRWFKFNRLCRRPSCCSLL